MNARANLAIGRRREAADSIVADGGDDAEREFEFSEADFKGLVHLAYTHTGISLADSKRNLVYSRVSRRLRALDLTSFRQYRELLGSPEGEREIEGFIN